MCVSSYKWQARTKEVFNHGFKKRKKKIHLSLYCTFFNICITALNLKLKRRNEKEMCEGSEETKQFYHGLRREDG